MYDSFYELKGEPFRLSPDHNMAFEHKRFAKARAYMAYAFMRAEGFVMITGRPGTGKTTLVGALVEQLSSEKVVVAKLVCTQLKADDLLKLVAYEFGISPDVVDKGGLLQQLGAKLKSWDREGRRALLVVDEAQDLSVSALEELRLLTNIEVQGRPLLQIFLLGQPELRELILRPELEQVHQRLVAATHLEPLAMEETEAYICHRLEIVGWRNNPLISKAVYPLVFKFSEGIPRRINLIFSRLLLHCAVEQSDKVGVADIRVVIEELQNENLAAGTPFSKEDFNVEDEFDARSSEGGSSAQSEHSSESSEVVESVNDSDRAVNVGQPSADATNHDTSSSEELRPKEERERAMSPLRVVATSPAYEAAAAIEPVWTESDSVPLKEQAEGDCDEFSPLTQNTGGRLGVAGVDLPAKPSVATLPLRAQLSVEEEESKTTDDNGRDPMLSPNWAARQTSPKTLQVEAWIITLLILLSIGLVVLALTEFKVPFALGGM